MNMFQKNKPKPMSNKIKKLEKLKEKLENDYKKLPLVTKKSDIVPPEGNSEAQIFFMASLPNIGKEKAISLLTSYQCPLNALNNVDRWSKDINGLGPKITKKVKRVIHGTYEETEKSKTK